MTTPLPPGSPAPSEKGQPHRAPPSTGYPIPSGAAQAFAAATRMGLPASQPSMFSTISVKYVT